MLKSRFFRRLMLLSALTLVASTKTMLAVKGQAQRHVRSLSTEESRTDRSEERDIETLFAKVAWKVENLVPNVRLKLSFDKERAINRLFKKYHVRAGETTLFASEQYQKWARHVINVYGDSAKAYKALYTGLKKHFTDYELATFILEGLAHQKTEGVAQKYHDLQMQDWVANKKALEVFTALKLDIDEGNVFNNPLLETYVSFARRLPRGSSNEQPIFDELLRMLKLKIDVGRLIKMLGATNVDLSQGSVGGGIMKALLCNPITKKPIDPHWYVEYVFKQNAIVDSSTVRLSLSYAKGSLKKAEYEKLLLDLVNDLWDERKVKAKTLATVITAAQKDVSTRTFATHYLEKLFEEWEKEGKTSKDVFQILELDPAKVSAEAMEEDPLLETWFAFAFRSHATDAEVPHA